MPSLFGSEEHTSELQSLRHVVCRLCLDRKSTRLNSSHLGISYAVFCLEKNRTRLNSSHLGISYAVSCLQEYTGRNDGSRNRARVQGHRASQLLVRLRPFFFFF